MNPTTFVGGVQVGAPGTIPFGFNAAVSPPRSCPANPGGGVPDGTQLRALTQNPRAASGGNDAGAGGGNNAASAPPAASAQPSFRLQNGLDAQELNASFESLTASSRCTGRLLHHAKVVRRF